MAAREAPVRKQYGSKQSSHALFFGPAVRGPVELILRMDGRAETPEHFLLRMIHQCERSRSNLVAVIIEFDAETWPQTRRQGRLSPPHAASQTAFPQSDAALRDA